MKRVSAPQEAESEQEAARARTSGPDPALSLAVEALAEVTRDGPTGRSFDGSIGVMVKSSIRNQLAGVPVITGGRAATGRTEILPPEPVRLAAQVTGGGTFDVMAVESAHAASSSREPSSLLDAGRQSTLGLSLPLDQCDVRLALGDGAPEAYGLIAYKRERSSGRAFEQDHGELVAEVPAGVPPARLPVSYPGYYPVLTILDPDSRSWCVRSWCVRPSQRCWWLRVVEASSSPRTTRSRWTRRPPPSRSAEKTRA
eukprot:7382060-Prymnesium_polylepis.1